MRLPTFVFAMASALGLTTPAAAGYRDTSQPIGVVVNLDLQRYLGKWYEIARFPNRLERGCQGVTAEYALNSDDTVQVVNTCHKGGPDGPVEVAEGKAGVVAPGKLERIAHQAHLRGSVLPEAWEDHSGRRPTRLVCAHADGGGLFSCFVSVSP